MLEDLCLILRTYCRREQTLDSCLRNSTGMRWHKYACIHSPITPTLRVIAMHRIKMSKDEIVRSQMCCHTIVVQYARD